MPFDTTVFLPLDPDEVFRLVTEPERLRRWKTVAARVDLRVGGEYRWTILPGHSAAGTFTEIEPGKRVVLTWGWEGSTDLPPGASTVSITLDAVEGGTTLRLVHDGLTDEQTASHAEGWAHFLGRLVALGVDGDVGPDEWAASPDPLDPLTSAEAALAILQRVLRRVSAENAGAQTPCEDFTVVELVDHVAESIGRIGAALGVPLPDAALPAPAEARIADIAQKTLEALRARGLHGTLDLGSDGLPAYTVANILNLEFLVHACDLATATGQRLEVAPALSDYVLDLARQTITDPVRGSGSFHPAIEVEDYLPGERLVMRIMEGPFPMRTEYTWAALDDSRTRMTLGNSGMPSGFSRFAAPIMATAMRSANQGDLQRLAGILETAGADG